MAIQQSSRVLINEPALQVLPSLAIAIGLNEAIFLQQVQYWLAGSKHVHDGRRWIYNTYEDWTKQFPFWSERTIKRIVDDLRNRDVLLTRSDLNQHPFDRTLWYSIDYEALDNEIGSLSIVTSPHNDRGQADTVYTNRLPETNAAAAGGDAAKPEITDYVAAYQRIWGLMISSSYIGEQVQEWEKRVPIEAWIYALEESAKSRKIGNWKYLEGILQRVEQEGYKSQASTKQESQLDFSIEEVV